MSQLESLSDPKTCLRRLILVASGKSGRKLAILQRDLSARVQRVANYIADFSPLKQLGAFQELERLAVPAIEALVDKRSGAKEGKPATGVRLE